jgi:hypothetical protein
MFVPSRPKSKTNTTTKHSPNKEPTTQLVLSNYKIISAHNMQENKQEKNKNSNNTPHFFLPSPSTVESIVIFKF